jgi:hypothetical protein
LGKARHGEAFCFRAALVADNSKQLCRWIEGAKHSEFGLMQAVTDFAINPAFSRVILRILEGVSSGGIRVNFLECGAPPGDSNTPPSGS